MADNLNELIPDDIRLSPRDINHKDVEEAIRFLLGVCSMNKEAAVMGALWELCLYAQAEMVGMAEDGFCGEISKSCSGTIRELTTITGEETPWFISTVVCPQCSYEYVAEDGQSIEAERTSIEDHGRCWACQKKWQHGELDWQEE